MRKGLQEFMRNLAKVIFDRSTPETLRNNVLQAFPLLVASVIIGLIAVVYAEFFLWCEHFLFKVFKWNKWWLLAITPVSFLLAYLTVQTFARGARGSGIPQVMTAIELSPKHSEKMPMLLGLRVMLTKIASSLIMIIGGGAVGREGPTIQVAGSVFYIIHKLTPASWPRLSRQSYILTGAAAGLAAAFNTPLGGIVFAVEELSKTHIRFFRTALLSAVIIAGLTAQALFGPYLYLGYPDVKGIGMSMLFAVALTAMISGLAGSLMSKGILAILKWQRGFSRTAMIFYVIGGGLAIALIAIFITPQVLGSGKEVINTGLFMEQKSVTGETVLMRLAGPMIAFTTGASGGIFAPSLAGGAAVGEFLAGLMDLRGAQANILILGGMVGFLTGVTRTPFTAAMLVLEMTDRHSVIFHLLIAATFANVISLLIDRRSLYDHLKEAYTKEITEEKPG